MPRPLGNSWPSLPCLLVLVVSITFGLVKWWNFTVAGSTAPTDFTQDYLAALALRHGGDLYGTITAQSRELFGSSIPGNFHPPFNALFFIPFSYLPFSQAFVIWNLCSLVAYVILITMLLRTYGLLTFRWMPLSALLLLWEPFTSGTGLGQSSVVLALIIAAGFILLRSGRESLAGALFALATLIKLFPGLSLIYLVLSRRWRSAAAFVITASAGALLTLLIAGSDNVFFYITSVIPAHLYIFASFPLNLSIEGIVRTIFESSQYSEPALKDMNHASAVASVTNGCFLLFAVMMGWCHREARHADHLFALFCITMLLISPVTWSFTCVILLLPLAILLRDGIESSDYTLLRLVAVVLILFAIPSRAWTDYIIGIYAPAPAPWYAMLYAKTGSLGLLILWFAFWRRLSRGESADVTTAGSYGRLSNQVR